MKCILVKIVLYGRTISKMEGMHIRNILSLIGVFVLCLTLFVAPADAATHTVQKGDTLYSIAKKYELTVKQLKSLNNLSTNIIKVDQVLNVSADEATAQEEEKSEKEEPKVVKTFKVTATAFTANCKGCSGVTSTGFNLKKNPDAKIIAVDPKIIPLGTKVWVEGYGEAIAADKGGSIKGNKIDVFMSSTKKATNWGRRTVTVKILE